MCKDPLDFYLSRLLFALKFTEVWPKDPPFTRQIEVERILKFNGLPGELVGRLLLLLHPYIQEGLVWKNEGNGCFFLFFSFLFGLFISSSPNL